MLWFVLCSAPGWVIGCALHLMGSPQWLEWGILTSIALGMGGYIFIHTDERWRKHSSRKRSS